MRAVGVLLVIIGLGLGAYVGLWVMLVGGIVQIVEAVKLAPVDSWGIAYGILRVIFAGMVAGLSAIVPFAIGSEMIKGGR